MARASELIKRRREARGAVSLAIAPVEVAALPVVETTETPQEVDPLADKYLALLAKVDHLTGSELQAATNQIMALTRKMESQAFPEWYNWPALWKRGGIKPITEPYTGPSALSRGLEVRKREETKREWDPETIRRIEWLEAVEMPAEPFPLHGPVKVSDPALFLQALRVAIAQGPDGPRARTGALQSDLEALERVLGSPNVP